MTDQFYLITKGILEGIIALQGFFFAVFLWIHPKGKRKSNKVLSVFLLTMACHFAYLIVFDHFHQIRLPVSFIALALYGPLLLFYISSYLCPDWTFKPVNYLHAIVPTYAVIWFYLIRPYRADTTVFTDGIHVPVYLTLSIYLTAIIVKIKRSEHLPDPRHTEWLRFIVRTFFGAFILYVVFLIMELLDLTYFARMIRISSFVLLALLINGLVYKSLQYPSFVLRGSLKFDDDIVPKYAYSSLSNEDEERWSVRIKEIMNTEKPFRREDLSLQQLAAIVSLDPRHLSQIINNKFGSNFREFLNQFRIQEAKALLDDPANMKRSMKEIMYSVGFSSRSSFNTIFKETTGQTPTEYRDQIRKRSGDHQR